MKGRQPGRFTNWVSASVMEKFYVGKPGLTIEVWRKWKRGRRKLGTLRVTAGGLRWSPGGGRPRRRSWEQVHEWFLDRG
jgi:hypothetical protein